ncbi:PTS cellobiose transporter subunit IIB [Aerococcus sanguinicola]|uniref:PTS cellobiose transporter subunit IIB n=1 Tax=Aerococcus sanguinicola TaxID=119206 RepID=A0A2I1MQA9_9LACT|nr:MULTISPECIES: PTS cellobiose transporter subunit IIB [Aerococcus]MDK7050070.1 PTS cellobiose transporter subunit IIB [Aerococcus sanguinicola]OFT93387.1 PTS cellobiose transporter subunit IIB [Aerococcus sp. HMSC23C02]PKZ22328.1 PTS cellobiose transporter subunit IIB [Aerococcus sanguinicola]
MKKALIICNAGMSSSMIAQKVTQFFEGRDLPIQVEATTVTKGKDIIEKDQYDLYLLSPQVKMASENLTKSAKAKNKPLLNIEPEAYLPTEESTIKLAMQIFPVFKEDLKREKAEREGR